MSGTDRHDVRDSAIYRAGCDPRVVEEQAVVGKPATSYEKREKTEGDDDDDIDRSEPLRPTLA